MGHHHQPWSGYSGADSLPCYAAQTVCPGAVRYKDPSQARVACLLGYIVRVDKDKLDKGKRNMLLLFITLDK